jgi:hypothetical protein
MIMVARLPDKAVRAVQCVWLDQDARNLLNLDGTKIKRTRGVSKVVQSHGSLAPPPARSCWLKDPETGLSVWAATGHETHIAFGALSRHPQPPLGRRVALCRDDDAIHSPADQAVKRLVSRWRRAGVDVVLATPWAVRRGDRSDFNKVIQASGAEDVRARIATALSPDPNEPVQRVPIEEARDICAEAVDWFFASVLAYRRMWDEAEPEVRKAKQSRADSHMPPEVTAARKAQEEAQEAARAATEVRARVREAPPAAKATARQAARNAATAASAAACWGSARAF